MSTKNKNHRRPFLQLPSCKVLDAAFKYVPETGEFLWRIDTKGKKSTGLKAGCGKAIKFHGKIYTKARIIWKMQTGVDPSDTIDHKDGNFLNHKWSNLRLATFSQQNCNRDTKLPASGYHGIHCNKTSWTALIKVEGKQIRSTFKTLSEALQERDRMENKYHGEFRYDRRRST